MEDTQIAPFLVPALFQDYIGNFTGKIQKCVVCLIVKCERFYSIRKAAVVFHSFTPAITSILELCG